MISQTQYRPLSGNIGLHQEGAIFESKFEPKLCVIIIMFSGSPPTPRYFHIYCSYFEGIKWHIVWVLRVIVHFGKRQPIRTYTIDM